MKVQVNMTKIILPTAALINGAHIFAVFFFYIYQILSTECSASRGLTRTCGAMSRNHADSGFKEQRLLATGHAKQTAAHNLRLIGYALNGTGKE